MRTVPLSRQHDRQGFACGHPALDGYLQRYALQNRRSNVAAPFVMLADDGRTIIGFYTLAASSVRLSSLPENIRDDLPLYHDVPALLLGRLAVSAAHGGKGHGKRLIMDAFERTLRVSADAAAALLVVDAKDDEASAFYRKSDFRELTDSPRRFFVLTKQIAQILKEAAQQDG